MRSLGIWIIILTIGSAILPYIGMQFILLSWVDAWGPSIGWMIRGGLLVLGGLMLVAAGSGAKTQGRG